MDEAPREKLVGQFFVSFELGRFIAFFSDGTAAEVDSNADADRVHDLDVPGEAIRPVIDMLMQIDEAFFGAPVSRGLVGAKVCRREGNGKRKNGKDVNWFHGGNETRSGVDWQSVLYCQDLSCCGSQTRAPGIKWNMWNY